MPNEKLGTLTRSEPPLDGSVRLMTPDGHQGDHHNLVNCGDCMHSGSGQGRRRGHFVPNPESLATELSIISSGEQVAAGAEVRDHDSVNLDELLSVSGDLNRTGTPSSQACGIFLTELLAPASDRLVRNQHSASSHQLFYIAEANAETKVVPNAFRNDLSREPMATIQTIRHSFSMTSLQSPATRQYPPSPLGLPPNRH